MRDVKRFVASENGSLPEDLNISEESKKVVHQALIHIHTHTPTRPLTHSLSLFLSHTYTCLRLVDLECWVSTHRCVWMQVLSDVTVEVSKLKNALRHERERRSLKVMPIARN